MSQPHLFFSAGEPSGDQHAAQMIRELQRRCPDLRVSGFGGPESAAAGMAQLFQLTDLAVMGVAEVLPLIQKFRALVRQAAEFFERERPDAVIIVDFPGFHWHIAKAARKAGVPVYFYCPPQLWAWAPWRIRKMRRNVDCVLSVLPFEAEWYRQRGVDVEFVGHPFFEDLAQHKLCSETLTRIGESADRVVALLPGSRKQEVERNFPVMLDIVETLCRKFPDVRFAVGCYRQWHLDRCRALLAERGGKLPIDLYLGRTSEVIEASDCCLMVSGSVSLELLARRKATAVMYRAAFWTWFFGGILVTCKFISLPNLIAGRMLMPEFVLLRRAGRQARRVRAVLERWLSDPAALAAAQQEMSQLADQTVQAGGVARAANVVWNRVLKARVANHAPSQPQAGASSPGARKAA